jgi:precorrin-2 dehydrogenase/sirohydrochlorin ferrochelatase
MRYYPILLDLLGKSCLVVGGGRVAERKVLTLLKTGCHVTVWSPRLTTKLMVLARSHAIAHRRAGYRHGSLGKYHLVIAATDDPEVQQAVRREAQRERVLVNVVDRPELCDFIAPSVVNRGDLMVAISTGGASPLVAKRIRHQLERLFGQEHAVMLKILSQIRAKLPSQVESPAERKRLFKRIVDSPLIERLREKRLHDVDRILTETFGHGFTMRELGLRMKE